MCLNSRFSYKIIHVIMPNLFNKYKMKAANNQ